MDLEFSLVKGGPIYWLGQRLGLAKGLRGLFQMAVVLAAITWLPVLVLNLLRAHVPGAEPTVSFAWSLGTHTRLLAAIPLFFAAEALLGTAGLPSLADLGNSFEIIRNMRPVPFGLYQTLVLLAAAVLPMLPLLLTVFPLDELVLRSVKSLVGM